MPTNSKEYFKKYYENNKDKFFKKRYEFILTLDGKEYVFNKRNDIINLINKREIEYKK